ncbi:uncharacterized protein LOC6557292 [Drosophila grimshawi]|uniref:GH15911 n=1 Tax=Drosophila grimshawi TaxID=7222 RepID=B4J0Z2_DROGR|nr:uncharacterized protein LOC6557292 [Drosophila grimshawi]EDV95813.1 GH15911 [Drosophila grimshawi]
MFDPISDTPLVLAYAFMSLLVLIVSFILFNVVHKLYSSMSVEGGGGGVGVVTSTLKTTMLEVDALKTG